MHVLLVNVNKNTNFDRLEDSRTKALKEKAFFHLSKKSLSWHLYLRERAMLRSVPSVNLFYLVSQKLTLGK